uniref:Uncharacterized protein n=1 Tax=Kangiella spongicola TaxID=796379 RepID=A0A318D862_9GAMM
MKLFVKNVVDNQTAQIKFKLCRNYTTDRISGLNTKDLYTYINNVTKYHYIMDSQDKNCKQIKKNFFSV